MAKELPTNSIPRWGLAEPEHKVCPHYILIIASKPPSLPPLSIMINFNSWPFKEHII